MFVNGVQVTAFSTASYPPQNWTGAMTNTAIAHYIGIAPYNPTGNGRAADGMISEVYFIDGLALDATSFGTTDTISGQWIPKGYSGAYGTNGAYLKFANNSSVTNLGLDSSGAGNTWTASGFQIYDQVLDSPTNNFCTLNPLDKDSGTTVSNGAMTFASSVNRNAPVRATMSLPSSGKWYWEIHYDSGATDTGIGITAYTGDINQVNVVYNSIDSYEYYRGAGYKRNNGVSTAYGVASANGDTMSIAFDATTGSIWFANNGTWMNSATTGELTAGTTTHAAFTGISATKTWLPYIESANGPQWTANFGQGGQTGLTYDAASGGRFKFTPPVGFKALSTANLPAPAIKRPSQYFDSILWSGDGTSPKTISLLGFQPDLVWSATRNVANGNWMSDSVRGANIKLFPHGTNADEISGASGYINAFTATGFTVQNGSSSGQYVNTSGNNYVAWCWKKGTIPGFDIVTQNSIAGSATIAHGLGVAPSFIFGKSRTNTYSWWMYHKSMGATQSINCPSTNAALTRTTWQNLAPTASQFYVGNSDFDGNAVFYLWAEIAEFSKFGSYTGNGSADGPFVYCGFKPAYILIKRIDAAGYNWEIHDNKRDSYNQAENFLYANLANSEATSSDQKLDILSNGFKLRNTGATINASGGTYIFAAFAEAPFKYANAR
jgi:hypothetical protein